MSGKTIDRRIARTKSSLWQAMLHMLQRQDWDEINVQMICDRADVARSSFYAHFDNKSALLDYGFGQTIGEIKSMVSAPAPEPGRLATIDWLVDHTTGNPVFFARTVKSMSGQAVFSRFRSAIAEVLQAELKHRKIAAAQEAAIFVVAGCLAIIQSCAERGAFPAATELKAQLHRLAGRVLLSGQ